MYCCIASRCANAEYMFACLLPLLSSCSMWPFNDQCLILCILSNKGTEKVAHVISRLYDIISTLLKDNKNHYLSEGVWERQTWGSPSLPKTVTMLRETRQKRSMAWSKKTKFDLGSDLDSDGAKTYTRVGFILRCVYRDPPTAIPASSSGRSTHSPSGCPQLGRLQHGIRSVQCHY